MKILALFMIILTCITASGLCQEEDRCEEKAKSGKSKPQKDKHSDERTCSPFCDCAACVFSAMLPPAITGFCSKDDLIPARDSHSASRPIQISFSIWQPPRLS